MTRSQGQLLAGVPMAFQACCRAWAATLMLLAGNGLSAAEGEAWVEVRSPHFCAITDAEESEARAALRQFEGIREVLHRVLPGLRVDSGRPLTLLVLKDESSMKRFLPSRFEGKDPSRPAGWFMQSQDQDYAVLRLDVPHAADQPYFVLYHEYTHGIIHANFRQMPVWLDEGIADFYGATQIQKDRVLIGRVPPLRLEYLRQSSLMSAETFLLVDHNSPHYNEGQKASLFYSQSWAAVHYLFLDPKAQKEKLLSKLLASIRPGVDPLPAYREALGDLKEFIATLNAYARQSRFRFLDFEMSTPMLDRDFPARKLGRPESLLVRAEFLQRTHQISLARPLVQEALGAAPGLARAQAGMGFQLFQEHRKEQARPYFIEALRLDPADFRSAFYLGMISHGDSGQRPETPSEAVRYLEQACAARPEFAPAHAMLGMAYLQDPGSRSKAFRECQKAVELEPQNLAWRVNLGRACLILERETDAQSIRADLEALVQTPAEQLMVKDFAHQVDEQVASRKPLAVLRAVASDPVPAGPARPPVPNSLKFTLPEKFRSLGQSVLAKVFLGKLPEAIAQVETALAGAHGKEDRKALQGLLSHLRSLQPPAKSESAPS